MLIYNATIINEFQQFKGSVLIENEKIAKIFPNNKNLPKNSYFIDASDMFLLPGAIDTHVHFREPGLTHKASIESESYQAAMGGVTTYFEMPNTIPPTTSLETLLQKINIAQKHSFVNYAFYIAATEQNFTSLNKLKTITPGIKIFLAKSTGNLIFNDLNKIKWLIENSQIPLVFHSEDQNHIKSIKDCYNPQISHIHNHFNCRPPEATKTMTEKILSLTKNRNAHLHFLHITTQYEAELLLNQPNISFELCPHYLIFSLTRTFHMDNLLKVNPSIKTRTDRIALNQIIPEANNAIIGSDHAPHQLLEKLRPYPKSPSGLPSIRHFVPAIFYIFLQQNNFPITLIPHYIAHLPANIFKIKNKGFIRPNYDADLILIQKHKHHPIPEKFTNQWSIYQNFDFNYSIFATIVGGKIVYLKDKGIIAKNGKAVHFDR